MVINPTTNQAFHGLTPFIEHNTSSTAP